MTQAFKEFKERRQQQADATQHAHLQRVKQSLRPHNTPEWFVLGLYMREWFFEFSEHNEMYVDALTLSGDIQARFPDEKYKLRDFREMLTTNYESCPAEVTFRFVRDDFFAPYEHARSFQEIDDAKALPSPAYLQY